MTEDINNCITITKKTSKETLTINQKYVGIKEGQNNKMALHYKAPMHETVELEKFFENFNPTDKLNINIGGTGDVTVNYRGVIAGKSNNLPDDYDYQILMLEELKCPKNWEFRPGKSSRFVNKLAREKQ